MLLSFLDTGGASFANLPLPVTNPTIPSLLNLLQLLLPNTSAGASSAATPLQWHGHARECPSGRATTMCLV